MHALYYQDEDRLSESIILAQQFLEKKKRTGMEEFSVRYFINLARKDAAGISQNLQNLCLAYQRRGYPFEKIDKCFADEVHDLYRLVKYFDDFMFEEVRMPSHKTFLQNLKNGKFKISFHKDNSSISIHGILRSAKKYKEYLMCLFTGNHHNLVF